MISLWPKIERFAGQDTGDVVSLAFIRATGTTSVRSGPLMPWLYAVAKNVFCSLWKRQVHGSLERRMVSLTDFGELDGIEPEAPINLEAAWDVERVLLIAGRLLNERDQHLLADGIVHGFDVAAEMHGDSHTNVKRRVQRAREKLRLIFNEAELCG